MCHVNTYIEAFLWTGSSPTTSSPIAYYFQCGWRINEGTNFYSITNRWSTDDAVHWVRTVRTWYKHCIELLCRTDRMCSHCSASHILTTAHVSTNFPKSTVLATSSTLRKRKAKTLSTGNDSKRERLCSWFRVWLQFLYYMSNQTLIVWLETTWSNLFLIQIAVPA